MHIKDILKKIKSLFKKDFIKVSFYTGISTIIKMISGFVTMKVVAVIIGPNGIALLGQLGNFSNIVTTFATGGINSGITKYIAEYKDSESKIRVFIHTAVWITLLLSIFSSIILIIFSNYFSQLIFKTTEFSNVIVVFGFTIIFYALNNLLLSILNGYKEFKKYVYVNIVSSIVGLIFSISLVMLWDVLGALVSAVTYQSVVFFITLYLVFKTHWFRWSNFFGKFSSTAGRKLLQYSIMALVGAVTVPVAQIIVRSYLVSNISLEQAGIWEGMNRISGMYLMIITTSLGVYYLPRLSEIKASGDFKREVISISKLLMPMLIIITLIIFFGRDYIVHILFSKEFYKMRDLFGFQMIGDFFKIASWIVGYQMWAKAMVKTFISTEFFFNLTFVCFSVYFINVYGTAGATISYMINNVLGFVVILLIFRKPLFYNE